MLDHCHRNNEAHLHGDKCHQIVVAALVVVSRAFGNKWNADLMGWPTWKMPFRIEPRAYYLGGVPNHLH
jgi:hypothetical protein